MSRLVRWLRSAPITLALLAAVALFGIWVQADGGQPLTSWAPGAIGVVALLSAALWVIPNSWADVPVAVRVAAGLLCGYAAWSYLSITWAEAKGDAWDGANRTLLYLAVFALFALWRQRSRTAAVVLIAWVLVVEVLAVAALLRVRRRAIRRRCSSATASTSRPAIPTLLPQHG